MNTQDLAQYIDHTLLKPTATKEDILKLCQEAKEFSFMSVCVNPCWVPTASESLKDSPVKVCTVIGFPLGAESIEQKASDTKLSISNGATEIDYVINLGFLKSNKWDLIEAEMKAIKEASKDVLVKIILETGHLSTDEITRCTHIAKKSGLEFVKTSTGFGPRGASLEDVKTMRLASKDIQIKASGGVRDYKSALEYIEAGANRIGTSSGIAILKDS